MKHFLRQRWTWAWLGTLLALLSPIVLGRAPAFVLGIADFIASIAVTALLTYGLVLIVVGIAAGYERSANSLPSWAPRILALPPVTILLMIVWFAIVAQPSVLARTVSVYFNATD